MSMLQCKFCKTNPTQLLKNLETGKVYPNCLCSWDVDNAISLEDLTKLALYYTIYVDEHDPLETLKNGKFTIYSIDTD